MTFFLRSFLLCLIPISSIQALSLNEKEKVIAVKSADYTTQTIQLMKSLYDYSDDFRTNNLSNDNPDFTELDSKVKAASKHIQKGVKLSNKLIKVMEKRENSMSKNEKSLFEDLYLYYRGQEDFWECHDRIEEAKEENFKDGMGSFNSRLNKALYYIEDYQRTLKQLMNFI